MFYVLKYYLGLIGVFITILCLYVTRNFNYWKNKKVVFLKPIPFFGNAFKVASAKTCIGELMWEIHKKCKGPFVGFFVFDQPFLLVRDPELITRCLIKDFEYFNDRSVVENRKDDEIGSNILFILKNPLWRPVRSGLTHVFSTGKMRNMYTHMLNVSWDLRDYIKNIAMKEDASEVKEISMKFTTDIIAACAFGINSSCFKNPKAEFCEASRRFFDWNFERKMSMAAFFFAPFLVKLLKLKFLEPNARQFISKIFSEIMEQREKSKAFRGDLIDNLIELKNNNKPGDYTFDTNMLCAQAIQFFIAGFETTGSTIAFALYELSLNSVIQDRLRNEIKTTINKHGGLTYDAVRDMSYLDMTIKETLRKYPVLPYIDRRCTKPYTIPGTDVVIEKGIPIYISLIGLHMDPQYFPNPKVFDPERFTPENVACRSSNCYMPFGKGLHNCIGARFGQLGSKIAVITILNEFEVVPCKETPTDLQLDPKGILLAPQNGIKLHFNMK